MFVQYVSVRIHTGLLISKNKITSRLIRYYSVYIYLLKFMLCFSLGLLCVGVSAFICVGCASANMDAEFFVYSTSDCLESIAAFNSKRFFRNNRIWDSYANQCLFTFLFSRATVVRQRSKIEPLARVGWSPKHAFV